MKSVPAGKFKQTCLRLLDEVRDTRKPIVVTKRGRPIAKLVPLSEQERSSTLGAMAGTCEIRGDIVAPAVPASAWEALRK